MEESNQQKVWDRDSIHELLETNDYAVYSAILKIYEKQTEAEKQVKDTTVDNGVGFTGFDGEILSSFAERLLNQKRWHDPMFLTPKQMATARKLMPKYWKQLLKAVEERGGKVDYNAHTRRARAAKKEIERLQKQSKMELETA